MAVTVVWAFQPLEELNNQTGYVECDGELAKKLISEEKAQNPAIGALHFKSIVKDEKTGQTYSTRSMQAESPKDTTEKPKPKKKVAKKKPTKDTDE